MKKSMKEIVAEYNGLCSAHPKILLKPVAKFRTKTAGMSALKAVNEQLIAYRQADERDKPIYLEPGQLTSRVKEIPVQPDNTICSRIDAIDKGYLLYWNGIPCSRNHHAPRYMKTGWCKRCYQMFRADEITQPEIDKELLPKKKKKEVKI